MVSDCVGQAATDSTDLLTDLHSVRCCVQKLCAGAVVSVLKAWAFRPIPLNADSLVESEDSLKSDMRGGIRVS